MIGNSGYRPRPAPQEHSGKGVRPAVMTTTCKEFIAQALQFNINDMRTYAGHDGNLVIRIGASDELVLKALQKQAIILNMQTVLRRSWLAEGGTLYCIAVNEIYVLK